MTTLHPVTLILLVGGFWLAVLLAFVLGCLWRSRPVGVGELDEAYQRGRQDEREEREQEIRALETAWRGSK